MSAGNVDSMDTFVEHVNLNRMYVSELANWIEFVMNLLVNEL